MNKGRLLKLADLLETVDPSRFDMDRWHSGSRFNENKLKFGCGTTACAGGWACTIPSFKRAGLYISGRRPNYKGGLGFEALEDFFGITSRQSRAIFLDSGYPYHVHPIDVARKIKRLVRRAERNGKA